MSSLNGESYAPVPITAANYTPVLAPSRKLRFEFSSCRLHQLASVVERQDTLNALGAEGWKIVGIDDGVVYLQREHR